MIIIHTARRTQIRDVTTADAAPSSVPVLLGAQTLFNIGFYAVVPLIAVVLSGDFGLGAAAVGLVLGVRTFAQQGMFLIGGALADRIGARATILIGCAVRVTGFLALAASLWSSPALLWLFVAGTVLTGLGGALFSPGLNTLIAEAERAAPRRRITLFAWLTVTGEIGAVLGPLIGALLLPWGFIVVAAAGASIFTAIGVLLAWLLPRGPRARREEPASDSRSFPAMHNRRFIAFAALHAVDLVTYNQLYLTLPLLLVQIGSGPELIGLMFAWASILTLVLQLPIAHWSVRIGARHALRAGYLTSACGFLILAVGAALSPPQSTHLLLMGVAVSCLILAHLAANPTALALVPRFADGQPTGTYFGLLASFGGTAVLIGNLAIGTLFDVGTTPAGESAWPWLFVAALPIISALLLPNVIRQQREATGVKDWTAQLPRGVRAVE